MPAASPKYEAALQEQHDVIDLLLNIIPTTMADAFAKAAMLQIILITVLIGYA